MSSKIIAGTTSGTALNMSADTSGQLEIQTGAGPTTAITVTSAQNVGVGITNPVSKFQVYGATPYVRVTDSGTSEAGVQLGNSAYTWSMFFNAAQGTTNGIGFFDNNAGQTRLAIDTSGNVSIGSAARAGCKLTVDTGIGLNNTARGAVSMIQASNTDATRTGYLEWTGQNGTRYAYMGNSTGAVALNLENGANFSVNGGNVLVNTSGTSLSGFTGAQLSDGTIGVCINASRNDVASNSSAGIISAYSNYSTTQEKFIVRANGDVQNRTGSYTAYSDIRLKENVVDARSYTADLCKLRVVNYEFKADTIKTKYLGFVAQEVEKVMPNLVFETDSDGMKDCKGIKLTVLIPMLVQAVQELNAKVDAQAAEIKALKGVA